MMLLHHHPLGRTRTDWLGEVAHVTPAQCWILHCVLLEQLAAVTQKEYVEQVDEPHKHFAVSSCSERPLLSPIA